MDKPAIASCTPDSSVVYRRPPGNGELKQRNIQRRLDRGERLDGGMRFAIGYQRPGRPWLEWTGRKGWR